MAITERDTTPRALPSDADISGRYFGEEELRNVTEVLRSGTLNSTKGTWVTKFETAFAERFGVPYARCVTSGTAAIHTAIAALNPEPGDEIITTPITDMGAITPILYESAVPVFADVDPLTYNVTAETIEPRITARTRAIVVTHLFGNMCDMDPIMALARKHGLPVIEDAAQAFAATYKGRVAGSIGDLGCFSFQQGKHMTCGEGGLVVVNNEEYQHRVRLFVDKAWGYGDPEPDHYFLALNYRMTELQGAVLMAQLGKLDKVVEARIRNASLMDGLLADFDGVHGPVTTSESMHVYWKYPLRVDDAIVQGGVDELAGALKKRGIWSAPRYIQKPAFMCQVLRDRVTFGDSEFPFRGPQRAGAETLDYDIENFPGAVEALGHICVLPWNEAYTPDDVEYVARAIADAVCELSVA